MRSVATLVLGLGAIFATATDQNAQSSNVVSVFDAVAATNNSAPANAVVSFFASNDPQCGNAPVSTQKFVQGKCYGPLPNYGFRVLSADDGKFVTVFAGFPCNATDPTTYQFLKAGTCYSPPSPGSKLSLAVEAVIGAASKAMVFKA